MNDNTLALYVHWPFCLKKCPYCDFNSHVSDTVDHAGWRDAFAREMQYYKGITGKRPLTSIFFGGGTPSLMQPETVAHVIETARDLWGMDAHCEITLEANPTSIETKKFQQFYQAGVNRISVGVQSLHDDALQFLGREHSAAQALKALDVANTIFDRVSFDLIYARPNQTLQGWRDELNQALSYAKGHLSLYQLTIEDGTQFKVWREKGQLTELDYDVAGDMYAMTNDIMAGANMPAYEISNYASKGQESRHNLTYWRYRDYVGIGPGAHGRITREGTSEKIATAAYKAPDKWLHRVMGHGHGAKPFEILSAQDQDLECMMMGLRLCDGVSLDDIKGQVSPSILDDLIQKGLIDKKDNRVMIPSRYWPVMNGIVSKMILALENT